MRKWTILLLILIITIGGGLVFLEQKAVNTKPDDKQTVIEIENVLGR